MFSVTYHGIIVSPTSQQAQQYWCNLNTPISCSWAWVGLIIAYRSVTTLPYLVVQFSGGVSPAPQVPLLDASQVSRQEKLFHSLLTQFLSCIASFESIAWRPLSQVRATPCFSGGESCSTFSAWRKVLRKLNVFRRSIILKLLIRRPKDCTCDKTVSVPRPFW